LCSVAAQMSVPSISIFAMHAAPATRHMAGWQDRMVRHTHVHGKTARHEWQDGMAGRTTISTWQDCLPNMAGRQGRTVRRHTVAWQDRPPYMAGWQDRTVRHHAGACMPSPANSSRKTLLCPFFLEWESATRRSRFSSRTLSAAEGSTNGGRRPPPPGRRGGGPVARTQSRAGLEGCSRRRPR